MQGHSLPFPGAVSKNLRAAGAKRPASDVGLLRGRPRGGGVTSKAEERLLGKEQQGLAVESHWLPGPQAHPTLQLNWLLNWIL